MMDLLIAAIPLVPLIGFLLNGIINKKMPQPLVGIIASGSVLISFLISCYLFLQISNGTFKEVYSTMFSWINAGSLNLGISFLVDRLSVIMLLVVTGVGFLIHVYSGQQLCGNVCRLGRCWTLLLFVDRFLV
mgnify:CR=1 FL=1